MSKMKCILITHYRSGFSFFKKAVAKLSDFTIEKGFKAIRNVMWKYDALCTFFLTLIINFQKVTKTNIS